MVGVRAVVVGVVSLTRAAGVCTPLCTLVLVTFGDAAGLAFDGASPLLVVTVVPLLVCRVGSTPDSRKTSPITAAMMLAERSERSR